MQMNEVPVEKDEESERPVPTIWRPIISGIVHAFTQGDYALAKGLDNVAPVSSDTAKQIQEYIDDYGEELTQLSAETWESSVCMWQGDHWDVLVDLWTAEGGRSDLVLGLEVFEDDTGYSVHVGMVYIP